MMNNHFFLGIDDEIMLDSGDTEIPQQFGSFINVFRAWREDFHHDDRIGDDKNFCGLASINSNYHRNAPLKT